MGLTISRDNKLYFGNNQSKIVTTHNQQKVDSLKKLHDRLGEIIRTIGGITPQQTPEGNIFKAKERIAALRRETRQAWGSCPSALEHKLGQLDKLDRELSQIREGLKVVGESIDNEKPGQLILPGGNNSTDGSGMITDTLDILAAYNSLPKDPAEIKRQMAEKGSALPKTDRLTTEELKSSFKLLEKENWDFEKFNAEDCKIYPKLKDQLIMGPLKEAITDQIKVIDKKLAELKESGKQIPEVGVKLHSPSTTGKIMALETAKLRRSTLFQRLITPGLEDNLGSPDLMVQPIPSGPPQAFKIDKAFVPNAAQMKVALELNKPYKHILEKLFPEGLNMYVVPGYFTGKTGDIEGGMAIPGHPEAGVWLTSYNTEKRYDLVSALELATGAMKGMTRVTPSVLSNGDKDRARALAHEIGHAISYKLINDDKAQAGEKPASSIIVSLSNEVDFMSGWKGIRATAKLNNNDLDHRETRYMSDSDKLSLIEFVNYEKIAEDIRMTITGDKITASSKMTGIFDQLTPEGQKQLDRAKDYIKKCLIEGKTAAEALIADMQL